MSDSYDDEFEEEISVGETARLLRVHRNTLMALRKNSDRNFPKPKLINKRVRFVKREVIEWRNKQRGEY